MPSSERLKRQLLELSIVTLVTVIIWISYGVYAALSKPAATNVTAQELQPLPASLTSEQFGPLRDRIHIDEEALSSFSFPSGSLLPVAPQIAATPSTEATPSP